MAEPSTTSSEATPMRTDFPSVVITGMAMTTALATDAEATWAELLKGRSGITALPAEFIEDVDLPVRIGGQMHESSTTN